ncbi:DUF6883 domain-containing protein [Nostoc sp.]|uniref:DUF6883 domain-containing protein n=1 Tax=Nostoc sp. TaxID=1180 RepID=UPI002FEEF798
MTDTQKKLSELVSNLTHTLKLLRERLSETNEAAEQEQNKEEVENLLSAIKTYIKDGYAVLAHQQEISDAEFFEQFENLLGKEQAKTLWTANGWNTNGVLRNIAYILMDEPELRHKIEDRGINIEEIIRLNSNLLPNAENAVVDIRKLRDYCLNPEHDKGKDKARLFSASLGMKDENAEELRQILLEAVRIQEVSLGRCDEFGQRYILDFTLKWQNKSTIIRSACIIEEGSDVPRLTTCYPL